MYILFNTCYLCLTSSTNLIPLYHSNGEDYRKIKDTLPELVIFGPEVPQSVCCSCLTTTTSFYVFKKKCLENNRRLVYAAKERRQQQQHQLEKQQQQRLQLEQQQQQKRQLEQQQQQKRQLEQQQQQRQLKQQLQQRKRRLEQQQQQQRQLEQQSQQQRQLEQQQQQKRQLEQQQQQKRQLEQQQQQQRQLEQQQKQYQLEQQQQQHLQLEQQSQQQRQLEQQQQQKRQLEQQQQQKRQLEQQQQQKRQLEQQQKQYQLEQQQQQHLQLEQQSQQQRQLEQQQQQKRQLEQQQQQKRQLEQQQQQKRQLEQQQKQYQLEQQLQQRQLQQQSQQQRQLEQQQQQQRQLEQQQLQRQLEQQQQQRQLEQQPQQQRQVEQQSQQQQHLEQQQQQQRQLEQQQQQQRQLEQQQQQRQLELQQLQQRRQKEKQQQQQQMSNDQTLQFPEQPKQIKTTSSGLNNRNLNSAGTILLPRNEAHLQKNPNIDVINVNEDVAPFDYSTNGNYINLAKKTNYFERKIKQVVNNKDNYSNLQIQDYSSFSKGHKQTNSVVNNSDVPENLSPLYIQLYNSNINSNHEIQSKDIETKRTEGMFKNVEHTKHNSSEHNINVKENYLLFYNNSNSKENSVQLTRNYKNNETNSTPEVTKNIIPFDDISTDRHLTEEQHIDTRTTEKHFYNKLGFVNVETENVVLVSKENHEKENYVLADNIKVKEKFDSFCSQQETIYQNEIKSPKPEIVDSILLSTKEYSKKNDINVNEDLNLLCDNTEEQINTEKINSEGVFEVELMCSNSEIKEEYISKNFIDDIEVKENFDPFYSQHLTKLQKNMEIRNLENIFEKELKKSELDITDTMLLPKEEHSLTYDIDVTENTIPFSSQLTNKEYIEVKKEDIFENELKKSKPDVKKSMLKDEHLMIDNIDIKENTVQFFDQLTNKQKYIETRKLEEIFENELKCSNAEKKHIISFSAEEHLHDKNGTENFSSLSTQQLPNKQERLETRKLEEINENDFPCHKLESEDYVSLPAVEKNSVEDDVKLNFSSLHTEQISNGQKDLEIKNTEIEKQYSSAFETDVEGYVPLAKVESEDFNTLLEEDTETNLSTEYFEVKEEFVPYYGSDSKFYQELVNSINSESALNNSESNTPINNFYNNFHKKSDKDCFDKIKWTLKNSDTVTCPLCTEKLVVALMPSHLKTHVNKNHFDKCKCTICDEQLLIGMLPRHVELHYNKKVKCPVCDEELLQDSILKHLKMHDDIKDYKCRTCNKKFQCLAYLKKHKKIHDVPKITKSFKCDICNKKYVNKFYFEEHTKMHAENKKDWKYECEICKKKFYFKEGVAPHMIFHTGKKFECTICNKKFYDKFHLDQHQKAHITKPKIWKCSYCDKTFVRQGNMSQHRRIHIGIKKFECKICNMKFLHSSHLKQHEYTHTGPKKKKFKCAVCKKAFLYKGTLTKHMETHADDSE